jgi:hypothetical protein
VGHVSGDVNPNLADATLIASTADWILAELYRMLYGVSLDEAQEIVNGLVRRKLLLVHDVGSVRRVIAPSLRYKDQTLLLLASIHPKGMSDNELIRSLEYSTPSRYKSTILRELHGARLIEYSSNGECIILPPGLLYVENNYRQWLDGLSEGG